MNLFHASTKPDGTPHLGAACPRPLSRKKLRSLMRDNRKMLTGSALASSYKRVPGPGKFRRSAEQHMRDLEAEQKKTNKPAGVFLQMLRAIFKPQATKPFETKKRASIGRKR